MSKRSVWQLLLIWFVIVSTALTGAGVIPAPWSNVLTSIVGSCYAWGLVRKPKDGREDRDGEEGEAVGVADDPASGAAAGL